MRWIAALVRIAVALVLAIWPAGIALAGTSVDISVFATPIYSAGITGFTITYVSDTRLDLDWNNGAAVANVMVRAKYSDYPSDIPDENTAPTDGYQVYYGAGTSVSDTSMDFDNNPGPIYYRAWAQKADGKWIVSAVGAERESDAMFFLALMLLAVGLTVAMFVSKQSMLSFFCAGAWVALMAFSYTQAATPKVWTDIYYILVWLFFAFTVGCVFAGLSFRGRTKKEIETEGGEVEGSANEIEDDDGDESDGFGDAPKTRTQLIRERAKLRRLRAENGELRKVRWGEFK